MNNTPTFDTHHYTIVHTNQESKRHHRIHIHYKGCMIHMLHDIPLCNEDRTYNMICEVPKHTIAKMEIDWKCPLPAIRQDTYADGTIREYKCSPIPFNYGAFPQTWENPHIVSSHSLYGGDDDPLDVIDIGGKVAYTGMVYKVKVLGVLGMIDQDETDWKVIAINTCDPLASRIHNIHDIQTHIPTWLDTTRDWLRTYKIHEGKEPNRFLFHGEYQDVSFAKHIIFENHQEWKKLLSTPSKY